MKKNIKVCSALVFLFICIFFFWFISNDIFLGDDALFLTNCLTEGGKFNFDGMLSVLIAHLFSKDLPLLLHIHPHCFSMTAGAFIRAFDVSLLCIILSFFLFNGRTKNINFPIAIIFSAAYFCYACSNIDFKYLNPNNIPSYELTGSFIFLTEYAEHFGQLFNLILGLIFLYILIEYFSQNNIPSNKFISIFSVFAFITAMSSMFVSIVCGTVLISIYLYLTISNYVANKKIFLDTDRIIYLPLISYIFGMICFSFYPGYLNFFANDINFINFSKTIFNTYFVTNCLEFSLIIILSSVLYFLALNKSMFIKRTIFCVLAVITGAVIYFYLFSKLNNNIALFLTESQVIFRLLLLALIYLLFGACLREHTSEPKELKILSVLFITVLTSFILIQLPMIMSTMKIWRTMSNESKLTTYCIEKMYRFYSLRNKTALLPDDSLLKIFKISIFLDDKNIDTDEDINNKTFIKNSTFTDSYYKIFYKNPNIVAYKFINPKLALKIFFEEGGMIDAEEIKHINFQKLYDDKFVLNRAIIKSRYDN